MQALIDYEEDIFKLEAPTFTTIDRGPPEPVHRNLKLRWDYEVNLIGQKVLNPTIHVCQKCNIPILIYGRMIPCKHVFCHDCAKKAEKVCPRCTDKVNRVEQVMLGTLFMCTHGGSVKRTGSDVCSRTYLSQRDLQAHINHRHMRQATGDATPQSTTPTKSAPQLTTSIDVRQHQTQLQQQRHQLQQQAMHSMQTAQHLHGGHQVTGSSSSAGTHQMPPDYRRRTNETQSQYRAPPPPVTMSVPPPALAAYPISDHHRNYDRSTNLMVPSVSIPQPVMPPNYSLNLVAQSNQVPNIGIPPPTLFGTSIVNSSAAVAAAANMANASRTNLITVPIHDDQSAIMAAEYLQYNPQQPPPQTQQQQAYISVQQQQQQQQSQQIIVQSQYSGPPPPISYGTQTYGSTVVTTAFPPPQAPPPNTHYPPPPIYGSQPPNVQQPPPSCYTTQPPPTHRYPLSAARYDDHPQLGSPQYTHGPPTVWTSNPPPTQHNICVPPPSLASLGHPSQQQQQRPPFYH